MRKPVRRPRPEASELVSLSERLSSLSLLRLGLACTAIVVGVLEGHGRPGSIGWLCVATGAYLVVLATPLLAARLDTKRAILVIGLSLLADGVYLAFAVYSTGGLDSPLKVLVVIHVVAVTLLTSYRTGLKIAVWHSLLILVTSYAQAAGILRVVQLALPGVGDGSAGFRLASELYVGAIFGVALVTGAFASLTERELRGQKIDLDQLAAMDAEISADDGSGIAHILVERLGAVFGATRIVVLASPVEELELLARLPEGGAPPTIDPGMDAVAQESWRSRTTQLVRRLDAVENPRLDSLLPGGRNLLIVPLTVGRGQRLGIVALEMPRRSPHVKRWVVAMVERFCSQAALAMRNAWLADEIRNKLEENRSLRRQLAAENFVLESHVRERTHELETAIEEVRTVDGQRRELLSRIVRTEEDARQQIAGDIHDDPVQKLTAVSLRLEMMCDDARDAGQLESVTKVLAIVRTCLTSLRSMLFVLHPVELSTDGLASALRSHVAMAEGSTPVRIDDQLVVQPGPKTRIVLYRIAQEALANSRKHAQASEVQIHLANCDDGFLMRIADDGRGFSAPEIPLARPGHLGLGAMRERAEMVGGWCNVFSLPGGGTTVEYWVPAGAFPQEDDVRPPVPQATGV